MAKRLLREIDILVREAEWRLDANAYLKEQWQWTSGGLHCKYLCQQMFSHTAANGWSKHDHAICQGQREPSPDWNLGAEPTAMELIHPDSMWEDIGGLYQDVYQLWRLPRRGQWEEATEECLHQDVLNSLKEHLWLKWPSMPPEEQCRQNPVNVPWLDAQLEFVTANCHTHEEFMALKEDSCEGMLAIARDTHWQALVADAILRDKIEWLRHSISWQCSGSCWHSGSHWCSGSCWCRWFRSAGCPEDPQVTFHCGDTVWLWTQSPSPTWQKCWVTFAEGSTPVPGKESQERDVRVDKAYQLPWPTWGTEGMMHNDSNWSRAEGGEEELECSLPLEPHLQGLLSGE